MTDEPLQGEQPRDTLAGVPVDLRDYTRRTLLANERTYLAWWRTGVAALTVALAAARVVPELSDASTQWPYTLLGLGFALLGILCLGYGEHHRRRLHHAIVRGDFAEPSQGITSVLSGLGMLLGVALVVIIVVAP